MNRKLALAIACGFTGMLASSTSDARQTSGHSALRPWPGPGSQTQISDFFGAALNTGSAQVANVIFELTLDGTNQSRSVTVTAIKRSGSDTTTCKLQSFARDGSSFLESGTATFTSNGSVNTLNLNPGAADATMRLLCNVGVQMGIQTISWNP